MFNIKKMKSDGGADSGSAVLSTASAPATVNGGASMVEKRPSTREGVGLPKHLRKATPEQPVDASGSTTRTSAEKGKGVVELEEIPKRGYTLRELCKVEDQAGVDRYFTSIMMQLKYCPYRSGPRRGQLIRSQRERILTLQAMNKELKLGGNQELLAATEHRLKEYEDEAKKLQVELESLRNQRRDLEQEVGVLRSNLDGARNDQAHLEGDVLSLTEAATFLKAELKSEGPKAVTAYKASQGFELSLKKIGRVSYEYGYWVALERLRRKHPEIAIEQDPFAKCPNDAIVEMDLNQPFDDSAPSEK
ncbi:hypothetical protein B296_00011052 [Ensete ventricosum]|uniref:Uncharacterized protein n=1 Tax=Ensete ventricosum TaxID=4639 RepID=A0A426ZES3_ENSVE|nr:hypothetical protein B296_00011052 [Ensete ventricosum]